MMTTMTVTLVVTVMATTVVMFFSTSTTKKSCQTLAAARGRDRFRMDLEFRPGGKGRIPRALLEVWPDWP